jgi:hypothetical protein
MTGNSLYSLVAQCVLELSLETKQRYAIYTEEPEQDELEVIYMVVKNESNSCFHVAIALGRF